MGVKYHFHKKTGDLRKLTKTTWLRYFLQRGSSSLMLNSLRPYTWRRLSAS